MKKLILGLGMSFFAAIFFFACDSTDGLGSDSNADPSTPKTVPGVYVLFSGNGGAPQSQKKNLLQQTVAKIVWTDPDDSTEAFLARHGIESYNFLSDPEHFGTAGTAAEFSATPAYKYTVDVDGGSVSVPTRNDYVFDHWVISSAISALSGVIAVGDTADLEDFSFTVDTMLKKANGNTITLNALYTEDEESIRKKKALQDAIDALNKGTNAYDDENLIGSGMFAGESGEVAARRAELVAMVVNANSLLAGSLTTIEIEIDGEYYTNDDGDYTYSDGTTLLADGDQPQPIIEKISYPVFYLPAITEAQQALAAKLNDPLYQFGNFITNMLTLNFPATGGDYQSVTITTTGYYDIELWGASGGHLWSKNNLTAPGGKGAYVKGTKFFNVGDVIKVYIGGEGNGSSTFDGTTFTKISANYESGKNGGWNGGGKGGNSLTAHPGGSGGGGATDVRYVGTYIAGTVGATNKHNKPGTEADRIMVAAGGGGATQSSVVITGNWPGIRGGNAGEPGAHRGPESSTVKTYTYNGRSYDKLYPYNSYWYGMIDGPQPGKNHTGTIQAPTGLVDITTGNGGNGSNYVSGMGEGSGGGGGGYRGGGAQQAPYNVDWVSSGAGGISYIGDGFTGTSSTLSNIYGNGKAVITWSASN